MKILLCNPVHVMQSFCCFRQPGCGAGGVGAGLHGRGEERDGPGGEGRHPVLQRGQAGVTQGHQQLFSTAHLQFRPNFLCDSARKFFDTSEA